MIPKRRGDYDTICYDTKVAAVVACSLFLGKTPHFIWSLFCFALFCPVLACFFICLVAHFSLLLVIFSSILLMGGRHILYRYETWEIGTVGLGAGAGEQKDGLELLQSWLCFISFSSSLSSCSLWSSRCRNSVTEANYYHVSLLFAYEGFPTVRMSFIERTGRLYCEADEWFRGRTLYFICID